MYSLVKYSVGCVESVLAACISLFRSIFFFMRNNNQLT